MEYLEYLGKSLISTTPRNIKYYLEYLEYLGKFLENHIKYLIRYDLDFIGKSGIQILSIPIVKALIWDAGEGEGAEVGGHHHSRGTSTIWTAAAVLLLRGCCGPTRMRGKRCDSGLLQQHPWGSSPAAAAARQLHSRNTTATALQQHPMAATLLQQACSSSGLGVGMVGWECMIHFPWRALYDILVLHCAGFRRFPVEHPCAHLTSSSGEEKSARQIPFQSRT